MGSFEWMELQTLTSDINASRSRLTTARANKDSSLVRILEAEITEAEARRDRLLASITTNLTGPGEAAQNPAAAQALDIAATAAAVEEPVMPDGSSEAPGAIAATDQSVESAVGPAVDEPVDDRAEQDREAPVAAAQGDSAEGGMVVWDQLTPGDIQRALSAIGDRRSEMLARHAEELKSLEVEQAELESLEKAIDTFMRRMSRTGPAAEATASAA